MPSLTEYSNSYPEGGPPPNEFLNAMEQVWKADGGPKNKELWLHLKTCLTCQKVFFNGLEDATRSLWLQPFWIDFLKDFSKQVERHMEFDKP